MKELTDQNFQESISNADLPILVDFWAQWCGPCKMVAPILEELDKEMAGKVVIAKLNIEENPTTPSQFGIRSIPTLLLFKKGDVVATEMGFHPKETLKAWLESNL